MHEKINNSTLPLIWQKYEMHLNNKGLTHKRKNKLRQMFLTCSRGVNLEKATRSDLEKFVNNLHINKFKKQDGKNFSGSSKSDIKKFLKLWFKWYKGNNESYPEEVAWIHTNIAKDEKPVEKPIISQEEVEAFANSFRKPEIKLLILLLFDSGFRIQEMLSVKKKGLTWEEYDIGKKCFWLQCTESKTFPRKVPVPLFTDEIRKFHNSVYYKKLTEDDTLFSISYACLRPMMHTNSIRVLKKAISPHSLRHSSATLYAQKLEGNTMALCQRYGWSFSSKEAALYVRRSGAFNKIAAKRIFEHDIDELKERNKKLESRIVTIETEHKQEMEKIKYNIAKILKNLSKKNKL